MMRAALWEQILETCFLESMQVIQFRFFVLESGFQRPGNMTPGMKLCIESDVKKKSNKIIIQD